jgi:hypothetical protein
MVRRTKKRPDNVMEKLRKQINTKFWEESNDV